MSSKISIPSRTTVTLDSVDGDLEIGKHTIVNAHGTPATLKVAGTVHCEGDNTFECTLVAANLEAEGSVVIHGDLQIEHDVEVEDGSLEVHGVMNAEDVDVDETLYVGKDLAVSEADVGGSLRTGGNIKAQEIDVGGTLETKGELAAEEIDVGGAYP